VGQLVNWIFSLELHIIGPVYRHLFDCCFVMIPIFIPISIRIHTPVTAEAAISINVPGIRLHSQRRGWCIMLVDWWPLDAQRRGSAKLTTLVAGHSSLDKHWLDVPALDAAIHGCTYSSRLLLTSPSSS